MTGWLVINSFIDSIKFNDLYAFFMKAAASYNVKLMIKKTDSLICDLESEFKSFDLPDFVLFWDKDIYLAKRLEKIGLRVFNTAKAIEICDNKILTALCLYDKVKTPKTIISPKTFEGVNYSNKAFLKEAIKMLGLPMIIKEAYGSFGQQVYLLKDYEEASHLVEKLGHKDFLMQEFIASSMGRDIRINVVGDAVVSAMLRYNDKDFRSNISRGGKMKNFIINQAQEEIAIKACKEIGLDFAGVDILFGDDEEPIICELNASPHFKSSFECTGIDMSQEIMKYIVGRVK